MADKSGLGPYRVIQRIRREDDGWTIELIWRPIPEEESKKAKAHRLDEFLSIAKESGIRELVRSSAGMKT